MAGKKKPSKIVGVGGKPLNSEGKEEELPGLDLADPVGSLDLLGPVGRGNYQMAQQYDQLSKSKHNKEIRIKAANVAAIAGQAATVSDFASNAVAELAFTLSEAEARIQSLMALIPEGKLEDAKKADFDVESEWENRRRLFSMRVPVLMRQKKRLGLALAESISGDAPTEDDFKNITEEAIAAGFKPVTESDVKKAQAKGQDVAPTVVNPDAVAKLKTADEAPETPEGETKH